MKQFFVLAKEPGIGVACNEMGFFVGEVPLLEYGDGAPHWRLRRLGALNEELSKCYGLPVEINAKVDGLAAVARAIDRGAIAHAQIVALHLRLPDPPPLAKSARSVAEILGLAHELKAAGLLKADWDASKHPRWPAKSPEGIGGRFAPNGAASDAESSNEPEASLIPAQITMPVPLEIPGIPGIPLPSEIVFPPVIGPNISPREVPRNPYPDRPECAEEWARAEKYCDRLIRRGLLGKGDYRGAGRTLKQCLMGQVREDCGGNIKGT